MFFQDLYLRNYMHGCISTDNISFSRNCDIKATKWEERHGHFHLDKVYF